MTAMISCKNVSIRYITGDFKDIGLKEYFIRRLKHEYHVTEFWADRHVTSPSLTSPSCAGLRTVPSNSSPAA